MTEEWVVVDEFQNYIVSTYGRVINSTTGRLVKPNYTTQGALKIALAKDGQRYTRSLKVLVATAFVNGESATFDTPIQLDGNQDNVRADNLMWRPRWFAWKYTRQFTDCDKYRDDNLYLHLRSGVFYKSMYEVGVTYGVLFKDVQRHIWYNVPLFPNWEEFILAK